MKLIFWRFMPWYMLKLKSQQNSPFKIKSETDSIKANCLLEINNEINPIWLSIKRLVYKLGIKAIQNNVVRIDRDEFGKEAILPNPVFSPNQAAHIVKKHLLFMLLSPLFLVAEGALYYLLSSLLVPGGTVFMKLTIATFLALFFMIILQFGIEKHFTWRNAVERHNRKEISNSELIVFRDWRNAGYLLIVISLFAIICAGIARIFFLEYIPESGMGEAKQESVQLASRMASTLTLCVTLGAALLMGFLKQEQKKIAVQFRVLQSWKRSLRKRNQYAQELIKYANSLILVAEKNVQKSWLLCIELKRYFRMETEYDVKYEPLHKEYIQFRARPGFFVTADIYAKFNPIQCSYEELFQFGVLQSESIRMKMEYARYIIRVIQGHIAENMQFQSTPLQENKLLKPDLHSNGKAKEHEHALI